MNNILRLQHNDETTREWLAQLKSHLASDKFQGTETEVCPECKVGVITTNKDWISTGDLFLWIRTLEGELK